MIITSRTLSSLALAGALCLPGGLAARAQVVADDVVCSKCVDDTDIARDSVGTAKIKDKSIQAVDLAPNSVGTAKIKDLSITSVDLAPNSVGAAKIQDGAVTAAKLAPDAALGRILVIRTDSLDPLGNCLALLDTLASITDNDADNPYTILLEPGNYDCGGSRITMKPFVDIAGSGRGLTVLKGALTLGVVDMASNSELRHLTVEHAGGGASAVALHSSGINVRITDVVVAFAAPLGGSNSAFTVEIDQGGSALLRNVEITAPDAGLFSMGLFVQDGSTLTLENVISKGGTAPNGTGMFINFCPNSVTVRNSVFSGPTTAIDTAGCNDSGTELNIVSSQLDGGRTASGVAVYRCVDAYDGGFALLDAACN